MSVSFCKNLLIFIVILYSGSVFAQGNADHIGLNDFLVNWKTDRAPRGCLIQTGISGDTIFISSFHIDDSRAMLERSQLSMVSPELPEL